MPIRRSTSEGEQVYTVDIGRELVERQQEVVISFSYRSRLPKYGHMVHFDIDRPTKGFELKVDYADAGITEMKLVDHISSTATARAPQLPDGDSYVYAYDGWILPRAGVAFVWVLDEDVPVQLRAPAEESATGGYDSGTDVDAENVRHRLAA